MRQLRTTVITFIVALQLRVTGDSIRILVLEIKWKDEKSYSRLKKTGPKKKKKDEIPILGQKKLGQKKMKKRILF